MCPYVIAFITELPYVHYPLQEACIWNNYDIVKILLENGADSNLVYKGIGGKTPAIVCAVRYEGEASYDIVQLLIEHGADKDSQDALGKTALDYAIENENTKLIQLLE